MIAGFSDGRGLVKPHAHEIRAQVFDVDLFANRCCETGAGHNRAGRDFLGGGVQGGQDHRGTFEPISEDCESSHAARGNLGVRGNAIKRQAIPRGEYQNGQIGCEEFQRLLHGC